MFCISSSSAARDGGQNVRFTFCQDISPSNPLLQVNTPYIQYDCLVFTKPGKIEISKSQVWVVRSWGLIDRENQAARTQQRTHYGGWKSYIKQAGLDEEKRLGWTVLFMSFDVPLAGWWLVVCGLSEFFWLQNEINLMRYDILVISNSTGIKLEIYIKNITRIS